MNANLAKVLRVLKHRGLIDTAPDSELARLSGLSRKTINQNKTAIQTYLSNAPEPSHSDCQSVDNKILQTYIDEAINNTQEGENQII